MEIRHAEEAEIDALAKVWYEGWQDAHAAILPDELKRVRTLASFSDRLRTQLADVRAAGAIGAPLGFCIVKDDELYQLFVTAQARGQGIAAALVADAEARIRGYGAMVAWLACAIGNDRAANFYEKCGWHRAGTMVSQLEIPQGKFPLEVWRYEKFLGRVA
jgi:GNAT superfamily N-acetyltransferase